MLFWYLVDNNVKIWNEWPYQDYQKSQAYQGETLDEFINKIHEDPAFAKEFGNLGPVYGHQWRHFDVEGSSQFVDQLANVIKMIKENPDSR